MQVSYFWRVAVFLIAAMRRPTTVIPTEFVSLCGMLPSDEGSLLSASGCLGYRRIVDKIQLVSRFCRYT